MNQGQGTAIILFTVTQFSIRYDKQYTGNKVELYTHTHQPSDKYHDEIDITRETAVTCPKKDRKSCAILLLLSWPKPSLFNFSMRLQHSSIRCICESLSNLSAIKFLHSVDVPTKAKEGDTLTIKEKFKTFQEDKRQRKFFE